MNPTSQMADGCLIIPNWNGEEHLREGLDSVREQTVLPWQVQKTRIVGIQYLFSFMNEADTP